MRISNLHPDRFVSTTGELVTMRGAVYSARTLRANYSGHVRRIETGAHVRQTLRAGAYAWPGGYALAFVTDDGASLCFDCVRAELRQVIGAIRSHARDGWRVVGLTGAHESDEGCTCEHCGAVVWEGSTND